MIKFNICYAMCLFGISTVLSSVISDKNLTGEERDIIYFRQSAKRLKVLKKFKTAPAIFPTEAKKNEKTFCSGLDSNRPTCLRHGTVAKVLFEQSINSGIIYGNVAIKWNSMATVNGSSCKQYLQVFVCSQMVKLCSEEQTNEICLGQCVDLMNNCLYGPTQYHTVHRHKSADICRTVYNISGDDTDCLLIRPQTFAILSEETNCSSSIPAAVTILTNVVVGVFALIAAAVCKYT